MRIRRGVVAVAAASLLALTGTAAALAADERPAPTRDPGARQGPKCDRVEHVIANLERAKTHLEEKIARVEEKIASGDLSPEELARARAFLQKLQNRLEKLEAMIERMKTKFEQKCSGDSDD
jgi:septal ring factor EnvC (AmiA/AmiB activator)